MAHKASKQRRAFINARAKRRQAMAVKTIEHEAPIHLAGDRPAPPCPCCGLPMTPGEVVPSDSDALKGLQAIDYDATERAWFDVDSGERL